jgi:hypothetical protein
MAVLLAPLHGSTLPEKVNRLSDALDCYKGAQASAVLQLDWEANVIAGVPDPQKG